MKVHQRWCKPDIWRMWASAETRTQVALRWLELRGVQASIEDVFHGKLFGVEPDAVATVSVPSCLQPR